VLISGQAKAARRSIEALAVGALAVVSKPGGDSTTADDDAECRDFLTTLRLMADVRVVTRHPARRPAGSSSSPAGDATANPTPDSGPRMTLAAADSLQILAIAASTGGPAALQVVLCGLGASFPLPILIVQHITRGFAPALADWLSTTTPLPVCIAQPDQRLLPGQIYLAPSDHHLAIRTPGVADLRPPEPNDRFCPSADVLFESIAHSYRARAIGLVLTGMGDDGARGLLALRRAGAPTLAQSAESCVVYGMPRAAVEAGAIMQSAPLAGLVKVLQELLGGHTRDDRGERSDHER
jgi:two-component system chemotaxis response regulator CheB